MRVTGLVIAMFSGMATAMLFLLWVLGFGFASSAVGNLIHLLLLAAIVTGLICAGGVALFFMYGKGKTE